MTSKVAPEKKQPTVNIDINKQSTEALTLIVQYVPPKFGFALQFDAALVLACRKVLNPAEGGGWTFPDEVRSNLIKHMTEREWSLEWDFLENVLKTENPFNSRLIRAVLAKVKS